MSHSLGLTPSLGTLRRPLGSPGTHLVVMGVSGCGKSTLGRALAEALGQQFLEGDRFHPPANLAKMSRGQALDDVDREPWLHTLAAAIFHTEADHGAVVACSALKLSYRQILQSVASWPVAIVHLEAAANVFEQRMRERDHFMPTSLLPSQCADLEPLAPHEHGLTLDATWPVERLVDVVCRWLRTEVVVAV